MGWNEIRRAARATVHSTFSLPALFSALDESVLDLPINVRLHNKLEKFGDLDREGYARVIENVNQIVFDTSEVEPQEGTVTFRFEGEPDLVYNVINVLPSPDGSPFVAAEVTRKP